MSFLMFILLFLFIILFAGVGFISAVLKGIFGKKPSNKPYNNEEMYKDASSNKSKNLINKKDAEDVDFEEIKEK